MFGLFIMPALIFLSQIIILTVATARIIFISKGHKLIVTILGVIEVTVWLLAIQQIMKNLDNVWYYLAYIAGVGVGNYVGIFLEEKIAMGKEIMRIITKREASDLVDALHEAGYNVTTIDAEGSIGPVNVIFTIAKRKDIPDIARIVNTHNPKAFYTIEGVKSLQQGDYPFRHTPPRIFQRFLPLRKSVP